MRPEWWGRVECCRILSVPTPPILDYYTNLVLDDHSGAMTVWLVAALELVILALLRFLVIAGHGAVRYDCHDPGMDHADSSVITPLASGV